MSTPKSGKPLGTDGFEESNADLNRGLETNLAVQGDDEDETSLDARESGDEGLDALEDSNGDAFSEDDEEDVIPLPDETLNRGGRTV